MFRTKKFDSISTVLSSFYRNSWKCFPRSVATCLAHTWLVTRKEVSFPYLVSNYLGVWCQWREAARARGIESQPSWFGLTFSFLMHDGGPVQWRRGKVVILSLIWSSSSMTGQEHPYCTNYWFLRLTWIGTPSACSSFSSYWFQPISSFVLLSNPWSGQESFVQLTPSKPWSNSASQPASHLAMTLSMKTAWLALRKSDWACTWVAR